MSYPTNRLRFIVICCFIGGITVCKNNAGPPLDGSISNLDQTNASLDQNHQPADRALIIDQKIDQPDASPSDSGGYLDLKEKLFAEVEEYLTADDLKSNTLLTRLSNEYKDIPFSVVAEAVRHRPHPAKFSAVGVQQGQWSDPLLDSSRIYHAYIPPILASSKEDRFPLLIFLHGSGGNGADIVNNLNIQAIAERLQIIVIAPTSQSGCDWSVDEYCMAQVVLLVRVLKRHYPIDDNRVVLSGFSMGGRGSFSTGVAYPEPYCGLVPVAGSIGAVFDTSDLSQHKNYCWPHMENIKNLRLYYISGDQDMDLMLYQNRGCELCLKELGNEYVYDELKGQGHVWPLDIWEKAVQWTLERPRPPFPSIVIQNIAIQASSELPGYIWLHSGLTMPQYWAYIEKRIDANKPARLQAEASNNLITITANNVAEISIYLSDEMFNLDEPVTIYQADQQLYNNIVSRDPSFLLTEARQRGDRTMLFANRILLKLATSP